MGKNEIINEIIEIAEELLKDIDEKKIGADDDLYLTSSMSSIDYVKFLVIIEGKYGIAFEEQMLVYDKGITISDIADYVWKQS